MPSDLLTPVSAWLKLKHIKGGKFLFESVEKGESVGRYSFLGFDPERVIQSSDADVLNEVQEVVTSRKLLNSDQFPFCGGAVGFVGYEAVTFYEPKKTCPPSRKRKHFYFYSHRLFLYF